MRAGAAAKIPARRATSSLRTTCGSTHAATFNTATNDVLNGVQSGDMDKANSGYAVAMSELQWQADKDQLLFQYLLGDEPASSGRVRLIP